MNQFKVRPPDQNEMKPAEDKVGPLRQPKTTNPENINLKPVDVQIEHENSQIGYSFGGEYDHEQLVGEIVDEAVNDDDEKSGPLLLDPHTKVAAQDVIKVWSSHYIIHISLFSFSVSYPSSVLALIRLFVQTIAC